jgi:hypothetical protein
VIGAITAGLFSTPTAPTTNSYESIATVTVGAGGSSSIDFTSIPSTYKHLQIRGFVKMSAAGAYPQLRLNGVTSSSYSAHLLTGSGSGSPFAYWPATATYFDWLAGAADGSSTGYAAVVTDLLDYTDTNKNKTLKTLSGLDMNGSGQVYIASGVLLSTSAISSIKILTSSSTIAQYSSFALYGIKW